MKLVSKFQDEDLNIGDVVDCKFLASNNISFEAKAKKGGIHTFFYSDIKQFRNDWEDHEEPKEHWFINSISGIEKTDRDENDEPGRAMIQIGNYFETKEEAEKAVEKLKALTKLCKKGFEFDGAEMFGSGLIRIEASIPINEKTTLLERSDITDSLYLLFGGEK